MIFLTEKKRKILDNKIYNEIYNACEKTYQTFGESDSSGAMKDEQKALLKITKEHYLNIKSDE